MKWNCYINRKVHGIGNKICVGIETYKEVMDLKNTTKADMGYVCIKAAQKFNAKQDDVLSIPACTYDCDEVSHSKECDRRCAPSPPLFTQK